MVGAVVGATIVVLAQACSGSNGASCETVKCSNDPTPNPGLIQQCRDIQKGPCGSQYKDERSCLADNRKCTDDQHLDPNSEVAALVACQMKTKAYQDCVAMTPGDGG